MTHEFYMAEALALAREAAADRDIPVGCVIVRDGEVIGRGRNRREAAGDATAQSGCCGSVLNLFEERFNHRPRVYQGPLERECQEVLQDFFEKLRGHSGGEQNI